MSAERSRTIRRERLRGASPRAARFPADDPPHLDTTPVLIGHAAEGHFPAVAGGWPSAASTGKMTEVVCVCEVCSVRNELAVWDARERVFQLRIGVFADVVDPGNARGW